jgi:Fe2+ or Zn2+ uptake regulation protein
MTRQRAVILQVIRGDKMHHTAEEIFVLAKELLPTISRATVYNNLKSLEKEQIIRRITAEDSSDRYDNSFIPHGHLFCSDCGMVFDFDIPEFSKILAENVGCEVNSYELKVRCICESCRIKKAYERISCGL